MSSSSSFLHSNPTNHNTSKQVSADGEFLKSKEFIGSDFYQNNQQQNGGLARYRSAPSSFLSALLDSNTDNSSSGDESEAFFSALIDGAKNDNQMQYSMKQEERGVEMGARPGFQNGLVGGFESVVNEGGGAVVGSYLSNGNGNKNCSNLVRQSSSPAGFFNDYGILGEVGSYRVHNHGEASSSANGLNSHMNLSSGPSSISRFMPIIPEYGNQSVGPENTQLRNGDSANGHEYEAAFPTNSWNESPLNSLKRTRDSDVKMFSNFNGLENQNGEPRKRSSALVSHLSLPKTSAEMVVVENYLHFQQETTIPCQVRAKRGFATHPRSIAERVRRTRISKNIKKLQDLFPNMDKQTNTAEMLDLAVEYIKDLQKQVQTLEDTKGKCVCSSKPRQTSPST